jgi:ketosteroid isomerase-like protein
MPESGTVAVVTEMWSALLQGGLAHLRDRYDEFFSADSEWTPALVGTVEGGRSYVGRDEFADYVRDFTAAFEEAEWGDPSLESIDAARVLLTSPMRVKGTESGVPIEVDAAFIIEVRNGRIVAGHSFFSRAEAEEFLARA